MFEKPAGNCGLPTSFSPLMLYSVNSWYAWALAI